jgi:hypothetical protein
MWKTEHQSALSHTRPLKTASSRVQVSQPEGGIMALSPAQHQAKLALKAKRRKHRIREKAHGRRVTRSIQRSSLRLQTDVRRSALDDRPQSLEGHLS